MSRRVRRRFEVREDIIEIARYIARDSMDKALEFFDKVDDTLADLLAMPGMGGRMELRGKLKEVRSCTVHGFPNHVIIYRPIKGGIEVITVLQGARDLPKIIRRRESK